MSRPVEPSAPQSPTVEASQPRPARFSLERLSSAFARLMGTPSLAGRAAGKPQVAVEPDDLVEDDDQLPVTPRMIVEGMLFVGRPGGEPLASRDLASRIRDVTTAEVDQIVAQLNDDYRRDEAAYEIVGDAEGYRLQLRPELGGLRQRMRGRVKAARLTPAALEVLAVVAYRQGLAAEDIARLQGTRRQAILAQLVRRQLVRVERPTAPPRKARYYTTDRFNELFGVRSAADLPRNEDLDDS